MSIVESLLGGYTPKSIKRREIKRTRKERKKLLRVTPTGGLYGPESLGNILTCAMHEADLRGYKYDILFVPTEQYEMLKESLGGLPTFVFSDHDDLHVAQLDTIDSMYLVNSDELR